MFSASERGYVDLLQLHKEAARGRDLSDGIRLFHSSASGPTIKNHPGAFVTEIASYHGHIGVLEWWIRSGYPISWTVCAIDCAAGNGHIHVLEWWKRNVLQMHRSCAASQLASMGEHIRVLEWLEQNLSLDIFRGMTGATDAGQIAILEWWKERIMKHPRTYQDHQSLIYCSGGT
ncbi:hypothetical protein HK405_011324 [Cladochytrium tenue]|nr:hypothetical protein HK405_011324 [Cladochytrium tenue]